MQRYFKLLILPTLIFANNYVFAAPPAKKPAPAAQNTDKAFVAKVNEEVISKKELDQVFKNNPNLPDNKQNRQAIVEELVARELIIQSAREKKLDRNLDVREAINASTRQILFAVGADDYLKENPISDSMMREQYDLFVKNYPKEEYKVRHIILKTQDEAEKVIDKIKDGKSFNELARQSLDTESANNGGDIGWITPMVPQTAQQLANLKVGKVSDPIESPNGWEIVEVTDKRAARAPEYNKIKDRIAAAMKQELLRRYVQELRSKADIVIP